jgi:hypothetical protein
MEKVQLTVVPATTSLAAALEVMRDSGHGALLVSLDSGATIVTAHDVFTQLRRNRELPQTLESLGVWKEPSFLPTRSLEDSWTRRPETTRGLSFALESGEGKYAILKMLEDRAVVISADPFLTESFSMRVSLCRCRTHPETHVFQPEELIHPGRCNLDPSEVDCG